MAGEGQRRLSAALRTSFSAFLHRCFIHLNPGQPFHDNWHLRAIAYRLEAVERGGARLIFNVPPRSLKSISISVAYVAWLLGRDPRLSFVCVSYSSELALKHARDCRDVMQSDWYQRAFPRTRIARAAEHDFETTAGGGRLSTSVGGTLTGRGGDIIIVDDPIKPDDSASASVRTGVNEWYGSTLYSRLNDKARGSIIIVMQRVHEDDLSGHLLENPRWDHLSLPAIAEVEEDIPVGPEEYHRRRPGDALQPAREPLHLLEGLRRELGSSAFAAQYQQAPVPAGGALVERAWLKTYERKPDKLAGDTIVQSWDCATKDGALNDFSACLTALVRGNDVYLLDVWRGRVKFPDLVRQVVELARRYGPDALLVEDAASGSALIQTLNKDAPAGVPKPKPIVPKIDKLTRLSQASHRIEAGGFLLPPDAPWKAEFERELLAFPNGRTDDQVDALSQLLNWQLARRAYSPPMAPILYIYDADGLGRPANSPWEDEVQRDPDDPEWRIVY
jgi:predicted phage terminase large subunit-like protein